MKKTRILKSLLVSTVILGSFWTVAALADDLNPETSVTRNQSVTVEEQPSLTVVSEQAAETDNNQAAAETVSETDQSQISSQPSVAEEVPEVNPADVSEEASQTELTSSSSSQSITVSNQKQSQPETSSRAQVESSPETRAAVNSTAISGQVTILNQRDELGRFDVVIKEVAAPSGLSSVAVPIWSETGGQDDIIWYTASKQADGTYSVSVAIKDHKFSTGLYQIHLYYLINNQLRGVTTASTTVHALPPTGELNILNQDNNKGSFELVLSNVTDQKGLKEVLLPIWSDVNNQDDIRWYTANQQNDGTYRLSVSMADHKFSTGLYHIHVYYKEMDNQLRGVLGTSLIIPERKPSGKVAIVEQNTETGGFVIKVSEVVAQGGLDEVLVPVWSEAAGQDDLIWYSAKRQDDSSYMLSVDPARHNYSSGNYNIHVYYKLKSKSSVVPIAGTSVSVSFPKPSATVTIENVSKENGSFDVLISDIKAPMGLKEVLVPVWGEKSGQNDIVWYQAMLQTDNRYKVTVNSENHQYESGLYQIHVYLKQNDGSLQGLANRSVTLEAIPNQIKITYTGTGTYRLRVANPSGEGDLLYAVWSDQNDQDDLRWYQASAEESVMSGHINTQQHSGTGLYHLHLYQRYQGQMIPLKAATFHVTKSSYAAPYYSQNDPRWGTTYYGLYNMDSSGCVPTSMAMIISALKGQEVLPTQVANYLHYNSLDFNRLGGGTSSNGILHAAANWGLSAQGLSSKDSLTQALKNGYYVAAAVGASRFVVPGWTHEIVLKDYRDNMTYVLDPDHASNNGWYSIDYLYSIKSTDPMDNLSGTPFFKINDI